MEVTTDAPPSVLKIASMFASLSAQSRRVEFAKATCGGVVKRSVEISETFRAVSGANATAMSKNTVISNRSDDTCNWNRTRSRSSDSRPACLDLKVMDNRTKFDHAKALFENLERQSRQEQRQRTPHNSKKRVASPSPTRSSSSVRHEFALGEQSDHPNASNAVTRAGPPAFRNVTINKSDQILPTTTKAPGPSCLIASETKMISTKIGGAAAPTTIISTTRLFSTASSLASSSNPSSAVSTPPPVPPKPRLIDSPRTSSESSSAVNSPSQVYGKSFFQRSATADPSHSASLRNGISAKEDSPAPEAIGIKKMDTSAVEEHPRHLDAAVVVNTSSESLDKSIKNENVGKNGGAYYYSRITQQRQVELGNHDGTTPWPSLPDSTPLDPATKKLPGAVGTSEHTAASTISIDTTLNSQSPDVMSPQKPSSLYEPYWRAHRYGRQRLANGDAFPCERSVSPPPDNQTANDSATAQINPKRNYMLKADSLDNGSVGANAASTFVQSKNDPGRLDINWPPSATGNVAATFKSPIDETKDSGVGTDSPSTSTTDSRASSSMNAVPPVPFSNFASASIDQPQNVEKERSSVDFMTKEEASVLLSPSTRNIILRDARDRVSGDDGEVRSLTSRFSLPQDVDLKRHSTCSMESSTEQVPGLSADRYSIPEDINVNVLADGHFWIEIAGLEDEPPPSPNEALHYKKPTRVKFTNAPIRVFSTYTGVEYDRRNDDIDPVSASAEYELERRLEKMDLLDIELQKGPEGLGFSIIGMGVGADAGLEKLGIFVKSITPGGAVHRDGRICVCDQIVEVDGKSLVGVSQNYAASVLRSTSGSVRFRIGREKDLENSEIAALIRQSLEQDRIMREQEDIFQRRLNGIGDGNAEGARNVEMQEKSIQQYHHNYLLAPPTDRSPWNNRHSHESPLPSTDSVFAHDDDDQTPEQLVANDPHIERLLSQLREPTTVQSPEEKTTTMSVAAEVKGESGTSETSSTAFRDDSQRLGSAVEEQCTYTAAEDISRLLNDSIHGEDLETRFPSSGLEPETLHSSNIQAVASLQNNSTVVGASVFGQLRRTTPDLTSSTDSMNGSEIQLRINNLEAELSDVRQETDKYQSLLNDSKVQYENLDKKYGRAKKLIKDYQDREKDLLDRESDHLRQLREKDQQYANLVKLLKDKVVELEKQLQDAHRKRASIVESAAAAAASASNARTSILSQSASDVSPALAYLPAKKLESVATVDSGASLKPAYVRNVPIIRQTSASEVDGIRPEPKLHSPDFGVPQTELLDSTAAKCKAEVVKQSQVMAARALPTRRRETEVFIMCHHTLEHAHSLRAQTCGSYCGAGGCSNVASVSPCVGSPDLSLSISTNEKTPSPTKSSSTSGSGSPSTPRRLTARAALLLRKKATVNNANSNSHRHMDPSLSATAVGGGDLEKLPAVLTWTCDEVCRFLKSLGLEKYTPEFSINRIDGCKLLQLDGSKLKAMGVQNHSDRALIKKQIKEMKAQIERERKQLEKESRRLHKLEKEKRQQASSRI